MASLAIGKFFAEGSLIVVTALTALGAARCLMHCGKRVSHCIGYRRTYPMALIARQL